MGSLVNGIYLPTDGEAGWGSEVSANFRRQSENHVNVKAFGAVADGVHDDTPNIQAAIDAADAISGGGTVFFPAGLYQVTGTLTVTATSGKSISLRAGEPVFSSSNGPIRGAYIRMATSGANSNIMNVLFGSGVNQHSVHIKGLQLVYTTKGTGICLDLTAGGTSGQISGLVVENVNCSKGAVGIKAGGGVNARFINVAAHQCTDGWHLVDSTVGGSFKPNVYQWDNCYAQASTRYGMISDTFLAAARFTSCVFQGNADAGFYVSSSGNGVHNAHFDSCWWEFPGSDMIRTENSWTAVKFTACRFDGSAGGGGRHVFNNAAADASSLGVTGLVFEACSFVNLNGGKVLNMTNADPSASNDPYFSNVVFLGCFGSGDLEGIRTPNLNGEQMSLIHGGFTEAQVVTNAVNSLKPAHMFLNGIADVNIQNGLGVMDMTELAADAAAGSTNHARLYAKDNGSGKTQLVVRFPTGAVQVLATEP